MKKAWNPIKVIFDNLNSLISYMFQFVNRFSIVHLTTLLEYWYTLALDFSSVAFSNRLVFNRSCDKMQVQAHKFWSKWNNPANVTKLVRNQIKAVTHTHGQNEWAQYGCKGVTKGKALSRVLLI